MDLAADFNNIGVQLHRLQRYEEAEEMFKGAVQVLLQYKSNVLLSQQKNSRSEVFDALVGDDRTHQAASKMDDKATTSSFTPDDDDDDVDMLQDIATQETSSPAISNAGTSNHSSQASNRFLWSSSSTIPVHQDVSHEVTNHHRPQDSFQEANFHQPPQEGSTWPQVASLHRQQTSPPSPSHPSLSFSSPSPPSVFDEQMTSSLLRSKRDEFSVYMCLDAIQLDASASSRDNSAATASVSMSDQLADDTHDDDDMNDICRYDFETIVVLFNMALTLQCLDQLTLSCYIYDLADRVLCGQPKEKVLKDPLACKLALAICNNLGQIFMETGHWEMARAYINRLADFLLTMDPPSNAEQAKERLEFVLNIYWFDHPPSAAAA